VTRAKLMAPERGIAMRETLDREPFVPFEVAMNSGDRLRIEDRSVVVLAANHLVYCVPRSNSVVYVRLNQIAVLRIDDLWA
jgi:hypothetical protein